MLLSFSYSAIKTSTELVRASSMPEFDVVAQPVISALKMINIGKVVFMDFP